MDKWADYCISKLTMVDGLIDTVIVCKDNGDSLSEDLGEKKRDWMITQVEGGQTFCTIRKNSAGRWNNIGDVSFDGSIFRWKRIPKKHWKRK